MKKDLKSVLWSAKPDTDYPPTQTVLNVTSIKGFGTGTLVWGNVNEVKLFAHKPYGCLKGSWMDSRIIINPHYHDHVITLFSCSAPGESGILRDGMCRMDRV